MNIQRIAYMPVKQNHFGSAVRTTKNENNQVNKNDTWFFRIDLEWDKYADYLIEKYKNQDKVNVYCYACSDGSEPYSLAMILISKLGYEGAQKFFPIKARDIDDYYFSRVERGKIAVNQDDLDRIKQKTKENNTFITSLSNYITDCDSNLREAHLSPELIDTVTFEKGDLREDIKDLPKSNTVLMFRNAWAYLSLEDRQRLIKDITRKLDSTSLFLVGCHDDKHTPEILKYLRQHQFKETGINYCFEKKKRTPLNNNDVSNINNLKYLYGIG